MRWLLVVALVTCCALAEPPYSNPFLGGDVEIADPYVLKWNGEFYLYCSGDPIRAFHSKDLVQWEEIGPVLRSNPKGWNGMDIWAPEVVYRDGKFYMYYTATVLSEDWRVQEAQRRIGVAVADSPRGPFLDSGQPLTPGWAIDGSVFRDPRTGEDYLFYSYLYDGLEKYPPGAGIVVDRLLSPLEVANRPTMVTRGNEAWEDKDGDPANGSVRYTNEGPVVLFKDGEYYAIYSGGSWDMSTYALAYAVSSVVMPDGGLEAPSWSKRPPILRGNRGVDGPGHNGVVKAPNNVDEQIVYHARVVPFVQPWNRFPFLDRLHWTGDRLYVEPPSLGAMPPPDRPLVEARGLTELPELGTFVLELNVQLGMGGQVSMGPVTLSAQQAPEFPAGTVYGIPLTADVPHEVLIVRNGAVYEVQIDGRAAGTWKSDAPARLTAKNATITHLALTDAFYDRSLDGWREILDHPPTFTKHDAQKRYEFSANFLWQGNPSTVGIGAVTSGGSLIAGVSKESWPFGRLIVQGPGNLRQEVQLPRGFRYDQPHHLRMVRQDDLFTFFLDGQEMLSVRSDLAATSPAVYGQRTGFAQARYKRLVVEQNLLGNGGFEAEAPGPWVLEGGAMINESDPHSGRRRLLMHGQAGRAVQTLTLPAGTYELEGFLAGGGRLSAGPHAQAGNGKVTLRLESTGAPLDVNLSGPPGAAFDDVYLYRR